MATTPVFTVLREGEVIKTCPLDPERNELLLGRGEGCHLRIQDPVVSRQHALFRWSGGKLQVQKKSEYAPLMVNGVDVQSTLLSESDSLSIGPYLIKIQWPSSIHGSSGASGSSLASSESQSPKSVSSGNQEGLSVSTQSVSVGLEMPASAPTDTFADRGDSGNLAGTENPGGGSEAGASEGNVFSSDPANPAEALLSGAGSIQSDPFQSQPFQGASESVGESADSQMSGEAQGALSIEGGDSQESSLEIEPEMAVDEEAKTKVLNVNQLRVQLIFKPGDANVTVFEMNRDEVSLGRGKDCDVILNDKKASRKHSVIQKAGLHFTIRDLDSANGTYVNGEKIQEKELAGEDRIRIGNTEFQFKALSADYAAKEKDFISVPVESELEEGGLEGLGSEIPSPVSSDVGGLQIPTPGIEFMSPTPGALNGVGATAATGQTGSFSGIPGLGGLSSSAKANGTLLEKFKALPKRTQIISGVVLLLFIILMMDEEQAPVAVKKKGIPKKNPSPTPSAVVAGSSGSASPAEKVGPTFETLSLEQKQFVEAQHTLAFEFYKNREYDKALYEIQKIFTLVPDYKDAKEIERYAREGKRKMDAIEEERKKKEDEQKIKTQIVLLVNEAEDKMHAKSYEQAKELFSQILALDPDNTRISGWKREIEAFEEEKAAKEREKKVQQEINQQAWAIFNEGVQYQKEKRFYQAMETFQRSMDVGASDPKIAPLAKKKILQSIAAIRKMREPILRKAKSLEDSGDLMQAYKEYKRATRVDARHPAGYAGMSRVKGVLHDRAKVVYTEAVLAESYSDFDTAKKKYEELLKMCPPEDLYYERAQRKLSRYFRQGMGVQE